MSQDPEILPITELPEAQQETFRRMTKAILDKDHLTARPLMGDILEYYVSIDREIPEEIEVAYAHLLILENPDAIAKIPE
jgi:hypothetical protein